MKAADFIYHRAASVEEAAQLLDDYRGEARILAGGQSLLPMVNMRLLRPAALIDINGIEALTRIDAHAEGTTLGALVRYHTLETSPVVAERLPLLARMVRHVGDRQVRNRGTIGGSLVQGDPTGEMPLGCLVLGARARVVGPKGRRREIPLSAFYEGAYAAALAADEMLIEIAFPNHPSHFAFREINRRHNDFAVLSLAATGELRADGRWANVRLGLGGVDDTPVLVEAVSGLLEGSTLDDADLAAAGEIAARSVSPQSDMRASAEYRRHLVSVHVPRVLRELRALAMARPDQRKET